MDSTSEKNNHRVGEKNVTSGAATLERAWIHTDPAKKINKKNGTASDLFRLQLVVDDGRDCNRKGSIYGEGILQ